MRRLSRHIGGTVFNGIFMALVVFVGLDMVAEIIDEMGALQRNYHFADALVYVFTRAPSTIYEYLPNSALIGCIYGLGLLAGNSEVTVMRAAGISLLRLVYFVIKPVLLFIFLGVIIGEYFSPYLDQRADGTREYLRKGSEVQDSAEGLWIRESNEFMHFNAVFPGGVLYGVTRYQFGEGKTLEEASFSTRATYNSLDGTWTEENVSITRFNDNSTSTEKRITRQWTSDLSPEVLTLNILPPSSLPIKTLSNHIAFLQQQGADIAVYELAYWRKLFQPMVILGLVLVGVSFVFGPLREATMGFRVFIGVVIGVSFKTLQDLLGPFSIVFELPVLYAVIVPILLCLVMGVYLLRRNG
jgi:lipopolysaccharide export system permease protein